MKKLISLLMMLLLVLTCAFALAEDNAGAEPTATPVPADVAAETAEPAEPTEEDEIAKLQAEIETLKARLDELTDEDEELATLVRAVVAGDVKYCPHGRPIAVKLTRRDLDKQFKRIV